MTDTCTESSPAAVNYMWRSSIPSRWVKLKGESHFRPVNPLQRVQSNLEMMFRRLHPDRKQLPMQRKTQERGGHSHSPIRLEGKEPSQFRTMTLDALKKRGASEDFGQASTINLLHAEKDLKVRTLQQTLPRSGFCPITTIGLKAGESNAPNGYVVHRYARPKALMPIAREKLEEAVHTLQSTGIKEYMHRFETRSRPVAPPRGRKGFNGWKLTKAKSDMSTETEPSLQTVSFQPWLLAKLP